MLFRSRWEYHWLHADGRKLITGSVCVETLPGIDPGIVESMRAALRAIIEAKKESERKAKQAAQVAEVVVLHAELRGLIEARWGAKLRYAREVGGWLPPDVYDAVQSASYYRGEMARSRMLKSARGQADCLRTAIRAFKARHDASTG